MRFQLTLVLALAGAVPFVSGCGSDDEPTGASVADSAPPDVGGDSGDASNDTLTESGADAEEAGVHDAGDANSADAVPDTAVPDVDAACTEAPFDMQPWPVRLMLLLDQSGSMESSWSLVPSKWDEVRGGLTSFFAQPSSSRFDYGLDPFPDGSLPYFEQCGSLDCCPGTCSASSACLNLMTTCTRGCAVDLPPVVPMAPAGTSGPQILDYLALDYLPATFSSTPLLGQMQWYRDAGPNAIPAFFDSSIGTSVLVVISDGDDTCAGDPGDPGNVAQVIADLGTVTAGLHADHGIQSLAIGFGDTSGNLANQLNAIASNGGTQQTSFLPLDDTGELQAALGTVLDETSNCVVTFDASAVSDPKIVNVYLDGDALLYDDTCTDGWRWGDVAHERVELCGTACAEFNDGTATTVSGTIGCPTR
jgi:hypothetical protein